MRVFDKMFQRAGSPLRVVVQHLGREQFKVTVGEVSYDVSARRKPDGGTRLVLDDEGFDAYCAPAGRLLQVRVAGKTWNLEYEHRSSEVHGAADGAVEAPMTGTVTTVLVQPGETVSAGQRVALLTAMKMEHSLEAATSGVVTEVNAVDGQTVEQGTVLIRIDDSSGDP